MPLNPFCALGPLISVGKVFGLQLVESCGCGGGNSRIYDQIYSLYVSWVEMLMWSMAIKLGIDLWVGEIFCGGWSHSFGQSGDVVKMIYLVFDLYIAIQFSIIKRNLFHLTDTRDDYFREEKTLKKLEKFAWVIFMQYYIWLIILSVNLDFVTIPGMKTKISSESELIWCSIFYGLWQALAMGQLLFVFVFMGILLDLIFKRLRYLESELLRLARSDVKLEIEVNIIMRKHTEIWDMFREINNCWNNFTPVLYLALTHLTCYFTYVFLFVDMPFKEFFGLCAVFLAIGCVSIAALLSKLALAIYGNFYEIRRFSSSNLRLSCRLKILTFMKRFGKMPLGISVGGFFFIKKDFIIKFSQSLYSVFSSLLQLRDVSKKNRCHSLEKNSTDIQSFV